MSERHMARVVQELAAAADKLRQQPDATWHLVAAVLQGSADFYGRYPRNWNKDIEAASRAEVALARAVNAADWAVGLLAETCSCGDTYATYDGPRADCSIHGAIQAFNEASREIAQLRAELERVTGEVAA